jgi:hypothetical protein
MGRNGPTRAPGGLTIVPFGCGNALPVTPAVGAPFIATDKPILFRGDFAELMTWEQYAAILRKHPLLLPVSYILGMVRGVTFEEPAAVNLHGGVCEGGEPMTPW